MTFYVLRMTWGGITGLTCFARRFLAVACIVTLELLYPVPVAACARIMRAQAVEAET